MSVSAHSDVVESRGPIGGQPSLVEVVVEIGTRGMRRIRRRPSLFIPTVLMPLFLVVSFTGSFSGITDAPGYPVDNPWDWMAIYGVLQGAAFGGVSAAGMTAEDIEDGFFDRMLLAPGKRVSLLVGSVMTSVVRSTIPAAFVLALALTVGGATMRGGILGLAMVFLAAAGVAAIFGLIGLIAVYIGKSQRALMAVQVIVFAGMFLSTGQVPLAFQEGWLHSVARVNPMTNVLALGRSGFIGDVTWDVVWPGLVAIIVPTLLLGAIALRLLRRFAP